MSTMGLLDHFPRLHPLPYALHMFIMLITNPTLLNEHMPRVPNGSDPYLQVLMKTPSSAIIRLWSQCDDY
jgi:hypothetical protein